VGIGDEECYDVRSSGNFSNFGHFGTRGDACFVVKTIAR
jgi:hypothetical protein